MNAQSNQLRPDITNLVCKQGTTQPYSATNYATGQGAHLYPGTPYEFNRKFRTEITLDNIGSEISNSGSRWVLSQLQAFRVLAREAKGNISLPDIIDASTAKERLERTVCCDLLRRFPDPCHLLEERDSRRPGNKFLESAGCLFTFYDKLAKLVQHNMDLLPAAAAVPALSSTRRASRVPLATEFVSGAGLDCPLRRKHHQKPTERTTIFCQINLKGRHQKS